MGCWIQNAHVDFKDTKQNIEKFQKLLRLMNRDKRDYENSSKDFYKIPYSYFMEGESCNAILGEIYPNGDVDLRFELVSQLFAALFPSSTFSYKASLECSVGGGAYYFKADYDGKEISVKTCQTVDDMDLLTEEEKEKYFECELCDYEVGDILFERKPAKIIKPARNKEYEESFFKGDLVARLNEEWTDEDWEKRDVSVLTDR